MTILRNAAVFGCALCAAPIAAHAHVVAGARVFPVTLTFDDPGVGDEISLPAFTYTRSGADGGTGPTHELDFGFEYDKTITPTTALILNDGYDVIDTEGSGTSTGWENLFVTAKWQAITNAPHEFVGSLGIIREIGGSGTTHTGADQFGSTSPTLYAGKGLGDLPIGAARAFALTGELGYTIADRELKQLLPAEAPASLAATPFSSGLPAQYNNGSNNAWSGSFSVQYSIPYLQAQVRDVGLKGIFANMIPVVEFDWSSPRLLAQRPGHQLDRRARRHLSRRLGRGRPRGAHPARPYRRHQCRHRRPGPLLLRRRLPQHARKAPLPMTDRPVAAAALFACLSQAALVQPALAHAFLKDATPSVGSLLTSPPTQVAIDFTEGVELAFSSIVVTNGAGRAVQSGHPHLDGAQTRLAVALGPLPPGRYRVTWHATATDTHKTQGSFTFTLR